MKNPTTWALVSNGVRARILRTLDDSDREAPPELVRKTKAAHLRDHLSDRPGRSFSSDASGRRSALVPGSDPILHDMEEFARELVDLLDDAHRARAFDRLAMIAAPRMLGLLRNAMPPTLHACVVLERPANLLWLSGPELCATIRGMLLEATEERP